MAYPPKVFSPLGEAYRLRGKKIPLPASLEGGLDACFVCLTKIWAPSILTVNFSKTRVYRVLEGGKREFCIAHESRSKVHQLRFPWRHGQMQEGRNAQPSLRYAWGTSWT
jgi:hypothetical protein